MGTIYLVRHRLLDQIRVIKVMRAHARADPDLRRRFVDEAKMATRLNHPHLCTIHDFAIDDDATAYLVMEFIEGVNLAELRTLHGSPGLALSLEIAHQALLALGYLHRKNVVHRDVAPDNLMLSKRDDGVPHVKIIDLGIAKEADRPIEMTATGVFLGKLRYASPEQAGSLAPGERLDGRSDLYSLGVVLYELLTGERPFPGESPAELLRAPAVQCADPVRAVGSQGQDPARAARGDPQGAREEEAGPLRLGGRLRSADRPDPAAAGPQRSRAHARGAGAAAGGPAARSASRPPAPRAASTSSSRRARRRFRRSRTSPSRRRSPRRALWEASRRSPCRALRGRSGSGRSSPPPPSRSPP